MVTTRRIVPVAVGSPGDVLPSLAVGQALRVLGGMNLIRNRFTGRGRVGTRSADPGSSLRWASCMQGSLCATRIRTFRPRLDYLLSAGGILQVLPCSPGLRSLFPDARHEPRFQPRSPGAAVMSRHLVALMLLALALPAQCAHAQERIIPQPNRLEIDHGSFALNRNVRIVAPADRRAQEIAAFLRDGIREDSGIALRTGAAGDQPRIELRTDPSVHGEEAYRLTVTPQRVEIAAADDRGLFWGVQTLRQLLPPGRHAELAIPAVRIDDAPRYAWRGVMLDAARHFIPVSLVKQQIDLLSRYKLNVLHWHLTDDQGWRIEIRKYPKLTSVGAWRTEADGSRSGGFYTQQDIRDIVEYARRRNVMIVPEIEMPGHASAAIAAYPSLSCPKRPIAVPATWGVFTDIYCAGDEATFTFLHDVLDEVAALFPAPYIHIGGDEVPKQQWAQSASSQQRMHDEHLADVDAAKALANGNRLIVAGPFYLDTPIEELTTQDIYRINPFASPAFAGHEDQVLGAEAPLWSEYVTPRNLEAMLYPRVLALAERLWNPDVHDYADFQRRLRAQYPWLDAQHIAYGPEDRDLVDYKLDYNPTQHRWRLRAARGFDDIALHYTTDGSEPTARSPAFGDVLDR